MFDKVTNTCTTPSNKHIGDSDTPSAFQAFATASLRAAADSVFCINGSGDDVLSSIYEEDGSFCTTHTANAGGAKTIPEG